MKIEVTDDQIQEMVNRFLQWELPADFGPDGGVSFRFPARSEPWPIGTNLFTATQARQMIEHMLSDN